MMSKKKTLRLFSRMLSGGKEWYWGKDEKTVDLNHERT